MSEKKVTTEEFLDDEDNIRALRSYAKRENKKFGTKEEALEDFLGTYRGVMSNTGLAVMFANEVADIKDDGERLELGRLYRAVDEDLEDFAGQQSGLATTAEYIGKGILDPLNILGFGVGSIVGRSIGKVALNRIISNAFKGNISKEISKGAAKKTVGLGTGIGGVEGVGQGLSIENVKGADKLGLQDEMDLGNVALMGGIGAITGGAFGALGGRSAAKQLTKAGEVIKKQVETIENTTQGKIARSATVQNFVDKQTGTFDPLSVVGTYVKPIDQTKKLIDDPENYGEFGLIKGIVDGKAEVEFLPTTFGQTKNPKTGLFDERKTTLVEFNKIKGVSEANKRTYQKKFVDNYGLFFSKADIEKGKELLRADPSISIPELDTIFEVGLKQEDFENVSSLVFDVAQNFLENTKIDPNTASRVRVIMDDPMKRISEKFGELIRLGNKDRNLLSSSIANNLVRYNLTQEQFSHALLADISISMTKGSQMSSIKKLVDTNTRIGNKLEQMRKNLTPSQASVFEAVKVQREAERAMANKFGIFVDIWRSFLVTQPATTFRNVFGSALRVPGETLDISLQSSKFFTQFESKALGMDIPEPDLKNESLLLSKNLLNPLEQIELATIIAKEFPEAKRKVFDVFDDYFAVTLGDDSRAGGFLKKLSFASKVANVANRAQDRAIKSAGLMTELDNQVKTAIRRGEITDPKVKGIIDLIEQNKLNLVNDEMISKSLQFAYKLTYQSRNAGDEVIGVGGLINTIQNGLNKIAIAKLGVPFPNFLINGFVYTLNRGLGGGILKAAVKGAQTIGASKQVAKNEREKINDLTGKISAAVKKGIKSQKQKNDVATMRKEVAALEAKAGKRLQNVEQFRKGVVESAEGISLIAAGYGIRETMGGARYDELKIGNTTINVGPLFPLTPFLFLGELIRKKLNDEPIDAKLIGEGAQALTGLQTDRAGPFAKFIGGTQKFLSEINTDDPLAAKKTGELLGGMIGYIVKGFYTPFKAFDDLAKDLGPAELRQTFEKGFQEFITEEGDTYSKEMARGVFNEFTRQMFRGTSFQTGVFGEESASRPLQSVTGPVKSKPSYFAKQPSGISLPIPRGDLGDELARVGIDDYKLEVRSEVPEYTFQYKKILGELAKRNLEPLIQKDSYKKLSIDAQKAGLLGEYKGVSGLTDEEKRAFKGLGFEFENLKQVTSNTIKTQMPFLHNLHNFRKRYTKDEIRKLYRDKKAEGNPIPQLKYVGEATTDRGKNYAAEEQNKKLDEYAALINRDRKLRGLIGGRYTLGGKPSGMREGGYVTQMNALGFAEGGNVGMKGGTVLGDTTDLNYPMTESQIEAGKRSITKGSVARAIGPGFNYVLESLGEVAKGDTSKGAELSASKRLNPFSLRKEKLNEDVELKMEDIFSSYLSKDNPKTAKQVQSELKQLTSSQAPEGYKANLRKKDSDFEVENVRTGSIHEILKEPSKKNYVTSTADEIEKLLLNNKTKLIGAKDIITYDTGEKDFINYASEAAKRQQIIPDIFPSTTVEDTKYNDAIVENIIKKYDPSTVKGLMGRTDSLTNDIPEGKLVAVRPNLNSHINDENVPIPTLKPRNKQPLLSVQEEGKLQGKVFADRPYVLVTPEKKEGIVSFVVDQEIRAVIAGGGAKDRMMAVRGEYTDYSKDKFSIDEPRTVEIKFNPREHHLAVRADTNEGVVGSRGPVLTIADRIYAKVTDLVYSRNRDAPKPLGSKIVKDKKGKEKRVADKKATPHKSTVRHRYSKGGIMMRRA